ncbi:MAG: GFA family protein [Gammaproteobacteria bacterium]
MALVQVTLSLAAVTLVCCHCSQCRKSAGAPFQAVFPAPAAAVAVADPHGLLRAYRASPDKARWFCGRCGAPIYSQRRGADVLRLRAGLFGRLPPCHHGGHIFAADPAPWYSMDDGLPRYPGIEPGRGHQQEKRDA